MTDACTNYGRVELIIGNIVDQKVDAIVNAANTKLAGGGGVDGAIHRAAGPVLKELCMDFPENDRGQRCETGDVRTTAAGNLAVKFVIHAVGPFYNEKYDEKSHLQLRQVHVRALNEAIKHQCASIAFPAISTGAYRFPIVEAARTSVDAVCSFLNCHKGIELVRFVLFKQSHFDAFQDALAAWNSAGAKVTG